MPPLANVSRDAVGPASKLVRVEAHVELGEVEAEELDAAAQRRERAVGDALAAIGPQAAVEQLEIGAQLARVDA